jgi:hypothetical protein
MNIGDIIGLVVQFDRRVEEYYADLRDRASNDGVRLLTYYLVRRKRRLPEVMGSYPPAEMEKLQRVPLKVSQVDFNPATCVEGKDLPSDTDADHLLDKAIELTDRVIHFYQWLVGQPLGDEGGYH